MCISRAQRRRAWQESECRRGPRAWRVHDVTGRARGGSQDAPPNSGLDTSGSCCDACLVNTPCPTRLPCRVDPRRCVSSALYGSLRPALRVQRAGPLRAVPPPGQLQRSGAQRAATLPGPMGSGAPTVHRDRVGHGCFWGTTSRDFPSSLAGPAVDPGRWPQLCCLTTGLGGGS